MEKAILKYSLNRRPQPTNEIKANSFLPKGSTIEVEAIVEGKAIDKISTWYKSTDGFYYWGGGVEKVETAATLSAPLSRELTFNFPVSINWNGNFLSIPNDLAITNGAGVTIAIIDSGIDMSHPNLMNSNIQLNDFTGSPTKEIDTFGHGTALAGIIAGKGLNGKGINGIANQCKIISLKVQSKDDPIVTNYEERLNKALDFLLHLAEPVHIVNLSFSCAPSQEISNRLGQLASNGTVIIASAFNQRGWDNQLFPSTLQTCISVAAVNEFNMTNSTNLILASANLAGPFITTDTCTIKDNNYFSQDVGCSLTTAFISGCTALILSRLFSTGTSVNSITKNLILDHLKHCSTEIGNPKLFNNQFFGFIINK